MTLLEMSVYYADSAALIRTRIAELRMAERMAADPETARRLHARAESLRPLSLLSPLIIKKRRKRSR